MKTRLRFSLALLALIALALVPSARAANGTWDGDTSTDFTNVNNWVGGIVPASSTAVGNSAIFGTSLTPFQPSLFGNRSVYGLVFQKADGGWTLGGASYTLTIGVGGITNQATSGETTINANLTLSGSQTWTNFGGSLTVNGTTKFATANRTLTVAGGTVTLNSLDSTAANDGFSKVGNGTLALPNAAGANLQGTFVLNAGTLILGNKNALGTGTFKPGSSTVDTTVQASSDLSGANAITNTIQWVNSTGGTTNYFTGSQNITFSGPMFGATSGSSLIMANTLDSGKKLLFSGNVAMSTNVATITYFVVGTGNTEFSGNLSDQAGNGYVGKLTINNSGAGSTTLSGSNSYSGATTVNGGVLRLNSANALSDNSALTIAGGVIGLGYGDFTRNLASSPAAGQVNLTSGGGFAAYGADRSINFFGFGTPTNVLWASGGFMSAGASLILGADSADKTVAIVNPIALATAGSNTRTNQVNDGAAAIDAILAGGIGAGGNGTNSFVKTGAGTLELTGVSSYRGYTTVDSGTLMIANVATNGLGYIVNNASLVITGATAFLQTPTLTLADANARVRVVAGGTLLMDGAFTNTGAITVSGGTLGSTAGIVYQGASFQFAGSNTLSGPITISSTFLASNANMTFSGPVTISSLYSSDPSTNVFTTNVTVTASGALSGSNGDLFVFQKDFINQSTNQAQFNLSRAAVLFTNSATHLLSVSNSGAVNIGQGFTNFSQVATNFAIGQLSIASGDRVTLAGNKDTQTNALYVGWLDIQGAFNTNSYTEVTNALVLALSLPNINLYYDKYDPRNGWLNANLINDSAAGYNLWSGGLLLPIPEPTTLFAAASGLSLLVLLRRKSVA